MAAWMAWVSLAIPLPMAPKDMTLNSIETPPFLKVYHNFASKTSM
jgi:hypothetical protein